MPDLLTSTLAVVAAVLLWVIVAALYRQYHAPRNLRGLLDLLCILVLVRVTLEWLLVLPWMLGGWLTLAGIVALAWGFGVRYADRRRLRAMAAHVAEAHPLEATESAPHEFDPVRGHPRLCAHCYAPRSLHPRERFVRARPLGDFTYYRATAARFHEEGSNW